jgi:hypothetical protein
MDKWRMQSCDIRASKANPAWNKWARNKRRRRRRFRRRQNKFGANDNNKYQGKNEKDRRLLH